jgi:hypothetical protein
MTTVPDKNVQCVAVEGTFDDCQNIVKACFQVGAHTHTAQHSTAQHSTAQHSTAQHSTAQHSTAQHSTAQHHPVHAMPCHVIIQTSPPTTQHHLPPFPPPNRNFTPLTATRPNATATATATANNRRTRSSGSL